MEVGQGRDARQELREDLMQRPQANAA